jgi:hypothetical protein
MHRWSLSERIELIEQICKSMQAADSMQIPLGVHKDNYIRIRTLIIGTKDYLEENYETIMNGHWEQSPKLIYPEDL